MLTRHLRVSVDTNGFHPSKALIYVVICMALNCGINAYKPFATMYNIYAWEPKVKQLSILCLNLFHTCIGYLCIIHWLQGQKIARLILWMSAIVLQTLNPVTSLEDRPST